jgi:hypothetical protein
MGSLLNLRRVVRRKQPRPEFRACQDERGEIIILVLAILIAVSILVGALVGLATPIFAHARVVQNVNNTVSAADSGIEYGVQQIEGLFPQNPTNPSICPVGSLQPVPNPPLINGRTTLSVSCEVLPPGPSSGGISLVVIQSTVQPGDGVSRVISARAVAQVNDMTGATTIQSWRLCQDGDGTFGLLGKC